MTFDIPVALIIFKRTQTMKDIVDRVAQVQPSKVYILADGGRNKRGTRAV